MKEYVWGLGGGGGRRGKRKEQERGERKRERERFIKNGVRLCVFGTGRERHFHGD